MILPYLMMFLATLSTLLFAFFLWRSMHWMLQPEGASLESPFRERERLLARKEELLTILRDAERDAQEGRTSKEDFESTKREHRRELALVLKKLDAQGAAFLPQAESLVGEDDAEESALEDSESETSDETTEASAEAGDESDGQRENENEDEEVS